MRPIVEFPLSTERESPRRRATALAVGTYDSSLDDQPLVKHTEKAIARRSASESELPMLVRGRAPSAASVPVARGLGPSPIASALLTGSGECDLSARAPESHRT